MVVSEASGSQAVLSPPGVAGVLVGHPFDTVKVSLIAVLSSGCGGGADIGGRLAGLGQRDTPFW